MLLLQSSLHCQSPLPPRSEIICVSAMAFKLLHRQGISRLFSNCPEQNFLTVEWRQSNHVTPCRKGSDINARHMECINAVLAMEPGITFSTGQATVDSTLMSTNSSDQVLTASSKRPELSQCMGTAQTDASLHAAKASVGTSPLEKLNCKEFEEKVQEKKERARRAKISKANKGRVPWNKGKRGDSTESALQTQVSAVITDEEKENIRRQRISQANRGKVPWNKGGKHSSETKKRIRASVIERMKDPKIREKLRIQAEAIKLSPETKMKIRTGIIRAWVRKNKLRVKQEFCLLEWKEAIAEAARRGYQGDVEYEWNSTFILRKQARAAVRRKKREPIPRPDHLSADHKLRISAAIKAKWSTDDYRINVEKGVRNSIAKRVVVPRPMRPKAISRPARPKTEPHQTSPRPLKRPTKPHILRVKVVTPKNAPKARTAGPVPKTPAVVRHAVRHSVEGALIGDIMEVDFLKKNTDMPAYKDPEAEKKLEKLKSMRACRMHLEAQKQKEITERARALIAQAQEAAKGLEAAAVKDKNALAPLLETRKLLAEAVRSLESLNRKISTSDCVIKEDNSALYAQVMSLVNVASSPLVDANNCPHPESSSMESSHMRT